MRTICMFDGEYELTAYEAWKQERYRKPILPPKPYKFERVFPVRYTTHPWTVERTIGFDAHKKAFPIYEDDPILYVAEFERAKNLKPATAWIKPTHGSFA